MKKVKDPGVIGGHRVAADPPIGGCKVLDLDPGVGGHKVDPGTVGNDPGTGGM